MSSIRCTKAVVYKDFLKNNLRQIKYSLKKGVRLCCAVKADGYGCGSLVAAKLSEEEGAEYLAIATVDEGIYLRNNGIKAKLLLLSLCTKEELNLLCEYNITPVLYDEELIESFQESAEKNKSIQDVFLAIDTGMGRIGCYFDEAVQIAEIIKKSKNLHLAGTITHFAVSDSISKEHIAYTKKQAALFEKAIKAMESKGINPGIKTCSSSAAALAFPELQMDMIRPGIILYGYYPDQVTKKYLEDEKNIHIDLKPVLQFESQIVSIKHFSKGMSISYGRTWICKEDTDIAIIPAGYADGLLRRNSPGMKVTINGKEYPICGRICMDQCMVDIGKNNNDVHRWDKVIFFGPKEKGALADANDIANQTGTISYEVLTSLSKRVERKII